MMFLGTTRESFDWFPSQAETFCNKSWFKATDDYHGRLGPLRTTPHDNAPISDLVLDSFQERGLPLHPDMFTTGGIANGCGHAVRTVHNGVRTTAADYITGEHARSNVSIKTNCFVNRLILEERERSLTAAGVELVSSDGEKSRVMARKEVIISAGVYGSPPILMRSGIGAKEEVEKHGIVHRVELPGVGKNLMDHMVSAATRALRKIPADYLQGHADILRSVPAKSHPRSFSMAYWSQRTLSRGI